MLSRAKDLPRIFEGLVKEAKAADAKKDWKLKFRLAIVALHLGDSSIAADVHQRDRTDPTQQTVFIHDVFPTWHGDLNHLAEQLQEVKDEPLRAGICLSLGKLTELGDARQTLADLLSQWYLESPDSGTHGAAGWALRQWNVELPKIVGSGTDSPDRDWKVTPHGFTMVRIPAGQFVRTVTTRRTAQKVTPSKQKVRLTRDFWLSNVEVSVGLLAQLPH